MTRGHGVASGRTLLVGRQPTSSSLKPSSPHDPIGHDEVIYLAMVSAYIPRAYALPAKARQCSVSMSVYCSVQPTRSAYSVTHTPPLCFTFSLSPHFSCISTSIFPTHLPLHTVHASTCAYFWLRPLNTFFLFLGTYFHLSGARSHSVRSVVF